MGSKRHQINNHSEITHLTLFIVNDRKISKSTVWTLQNTQLLLHAIAHTSLGHII